MMHKEPYVAFSLFALPTFIFFKFYPWQVLHLCF